MWSDPAAAFAPGTRTLVTGAAGFVGANLVRRLAKAGCSVHAVVRPGAQPWRLTDHGPGVTVHAVDLASPAALAALFAAVQPELVFHLAAERGQTEKARAAMLRLNVLGAETLLELVRKHSVRRLVVTGSSLEYGSAGEPLHEDSAIAPVTWHGATKAAAHLLYRQAAQTNELPVVMLRLFHVYGPWESAHRLAPSVIRAALSGTPLELTVPGIRRDWIYVDDVCDALMLAADCTTPGAVFNIGSGVPVANEEFVAAVEVVTGRPIALTETVFPSRLTDSTTRIADCSRAAAILGWSPRHDLLHGIRATIDWYLDHPQAWSDAADVLPLVS